MSIERVREEAAVIAWDYDTYAASDDSGGIVTASLEDITAYLLQLAEDTQDPALDQRIAAILE